MSPPDSTDGSVANNSNSATEEEKAAMVNSLGEALAGMNMANTTGSSFGASPGQPTAPFSLTHGAHADNDGWGNYAVAAQAAFPGSAGKHDAAPSPAVVDNSHLRNESIDLFLSQSPSQTLGDDVFKFSHPNLPALGSAGASGDEDAAGGFRLPGQNLAPGLSSGSNKATSNSYGNMMSVQENPRRRTESPSCSATGTTTSSRSVSPYANSDAGNRGTIHAYRYDSHGPGNMGITSSMDNSASRSGQPSFAEDDGYSNANGSLSHGHGSHPSLTTVDSGHRSPFAKDRGTNLIGGVLNNSSSSSGGSPYDSGYDRSSFAEQAPAPLPAAGGANGQQPQVLYMAVPSPDGRGQVLQPVQMVQLPGQKNYSYVMQQPGAGGVVSQPVMGDASLQQHQPSMVLPPLPNQQSNADYGGNLNGGVVGGNEPRGADRSRVSGGYAMDNVNTNINRQYDVSGTHDGFTKSLPRSSSSGQFQTTTAGDAGSLYASPQRPPLDALLGQVRRLSRDQVGCRLVQQALDEEGPMAATLILNEGLPFWGEAMVDPFGNYLFQKILEKITAEERIMLLKSVSMRIVNASLNLHGTRSVQKVVELCALDEQNSTLGPSEESAADILTKALAPAAARLCIDSHGNHVIQRILLKLGHKHSKFVFDAVAASVGDVARHRHGCCVIQRCLDSPRTEARSNLVDRIVKKSLELMQDAYGNYVVQYVLDVCADDHVQAVCASVVGKVNLLAIQKFSSNVMEKCLERCGDRTKELYIQEMSNPDRVRELMMDPFGNYVVQRALSVATHAQAVRLVEAMRPHLMNAQTTGPNGQRNGGVRNTAGGRRIIAKICRRFPNFTLNEVGSPDELYGGQNKGVPRHQQGPVIASGYGQMAAHQMGAQQMSAQQMGSQQMGSQQMVSQQMGAQQMSSHHHMGGQLGVQQMGSQVGAPQTSYYGGGHIPMQQQHQQQSYYNVGESSYYDHFATGGHGAYQGM